MKKYQIILIAIIILAAATLIGRSYSRKSPGLAENPSPANKNQQPIAASQENKATSQLLFSPLPNAKSRIIKKPFGIHVSPGNSPVNPERFSGYHAGTDFETVPEEKDKEMIVSAICNGRVIYKNWVSGYGGVIIESCVLNGQPATVLYGHLDFGGSVSKNNGENIETGDQIAVLGAPYSHDTDGERKHLHLSIHKGKNIELKGYVNSQAQLGAWLNPEEYINFN